MLRAVKAEHYATWADELVPALGGQSPREMAKTTAGSGCSFCVDASPGS